MKIAFRADASVEIGSGHVMRCLTLANELKEKGAQIKFICRECEGNLCDLIEKQGIPVERILSEFQSWETDAFQSLEALQENGKVDWLVVDHYSLDHRWEALLRNSAEKIMVIDDLADRIHDCDLLLDQNLYEEMENRYNYLVPLHCIKLLGPRYALLRPEFRKTRENLRKRDGTVRRILVFFGGSDPSNETVKALEAIRLLEKPEIAVDVVVGSSNPQQEKIRTMCASLPNVSYYCQVDNMAELMAKADLAIGAGGSSNWERCCLGLPSIIYSLAVNQTACSEAIAQQGAILYLGNKQNVSAELLRASLEVTLASPLLMQKLSKVGYAISDGRGAGRAANRILTSLIILRRAVRQDCDMIFKWRNADQTRRFSGSTEPIPYKTHVNWFENVLIDRDRAILIGEIDGKPVGVIRYDRKGARAVVSVYLAPECKGQGLGLELISEGSHWIEKHWKVNIIDAVISTENLESIGAFEAAGFRRINCVYSKFTGN